MPKTPKGELTTAEIRKLIRAHNILTSIKIPKGATRDEIIKIVDKKGYMVNHEKKSLDPKGGIRKGQPRVKLEKAKELTKPKPKTELQKQKAAEAKAEKAEKKKKEERVIRKKAVEAEKERSKPKAKPKPKPKKEDEVRPKEKVGRPRVDPKKIKVIQPKPKVSDAKKKEESKFGYEPFKKKLDQAVEISGQSLDNLTKKSKERLAKIEQELKDGTNKRQTLSVKIEKAIETKKGQVGFIGDKFNLTIKFGLNEGEKITIETRNRIPKATILPFEKPKPK